MRPDISVKSIHLLLSAHKDVTLHQFPETSQFAGAPVGIMLHFSENWPKENKNQVLEVQCVNV